MRFKINIPVRMKNPWFWVGLAGVIFTAMGVSPETLTSWSAVVEAFKSLIMNPFMLGSVALAVLGDPTTKSLGDSANALTYTSPN